MKKIQILLILLTILACQTALHAETIYKKDGTSIQAKVSGKTEDLIWYELPTGSDIVEETSIKVSEVDKILADDGSVSKYSPTYKEPKVSSQEKK